MEKSGKLWRILSALLVVLGLLLGSLTAVAALGWKDSGPMLLGTAEAPKRQAQQFLEALKNSNYPLVEAILYGTPDLGMDTRPETDLGAAMMDKYRKTLSYTLLGECYAADSGVALDVQVTVLDLEAVTQDLALRAPELLEAAAASVQDETQIQDENDQYREEFISRVLREALSEYPREESHTQTRDITLHLTCEDGRWWVLPEKPLLNVIAGK